jgi:anti-anti-sigma factor
VTIVTILKRPAGEDDAMPLPDDHDGDGFEVSSDGLGRPTLRVLGEIDLANADRLADMIADLPSEQFDEVFIDLASVRFMDSTGIKVLVEACTGDGDHVRIVAVSPTVERLMEISGTRDILLGRSSEPGGDGAL